MANPSPELAADIVMLYKEDERFRKFFDHLRLLEEEFQEQINFPDTPKDEREVLVHVRARLKSEVIDLLFLAQKVLEKKRNTGQPE